VGVRVSTTEREDEPDTEGDGDRLRESLVLAEGVVSAEGTGVALDVQVAWASPSR
jgi:hypothetical protein